MNGYIIDMYIDVLIYGDGIEIVDKYLQTFYFDPYPDGEPEKAIMTIYKLYGNR